MQAEENTTTILGPCIGNITQSSVTIWLHLPKPTIVYVTLRTNAIAVEVFASGRIELSEQNLGTGVVSFDSLQPDSVYFYQLWQDEHCSIALDLNGLAPEDLFFRTLPTTGYDEQLDFLLMSCHKPDTSKDDGFGGFAVWRQIPEIQSQNKNVRFAILAGDQIYADEIESQVLSESDVRKQQELYLAVYRKFWDNVYYRKVLCSLPAILMWDDHDITDGWGSREDSFVDAQSSAFKPEWTRLLSTAKSMFEIMQAQRNPEPLSPHFRKGFDTCFRVGKAGFVVADLRSNRNVRKHQIWSPTQLDGIKEWVSANRATLNTLFFVSSVVFSHGAPQVERGILKYWFYVLDFVNWLSRFRRFTSLGTRFTDAVGDLRDDINDSWGADVNSEEADRVLDFLFGVQNPTGGEKQVNVVILSGDIHTPGYSAIYSADPQHVKAVIPHVVATPVAYKPFSWWGEAVFRHLTRVVALGKKQTYSAQVSHHFCYRNVVVVSLRNYESDDSFIKVKYYLEGFPEPQVVLFDLIHSSRREAIKWSKPEAKQPLP